MSCSSPEHVSKKLGVHVGVHFGVHDDVYDENILISHNMNSSLSQVAEAIRSILVIGALANFLYI